MHATFPAWDTPKHLHAQTSSLTQEANARIDPTIPGKMAYRIHVHLECEPYTALSAPLTEIVVWKMREGASRAVVEQLLTKLMAIVSKIPIEEGKYKNGWGRILNEDAERQFIVLIGWTDMEVKQLQHVYPETFAEVDLRVGIRDRCLQFAGWACGPCGTRGSHREADPAYAPSKGAITAADAPALGGTSVSSPASAWDRMIPC